MVLRCVVLAVFNRILDFHIVVLSFLLLDSSYSVCTDLLEIMVEAPRCYAVAGNNLIEVFVDVDVDA